MASPGFTRRPLAILLMGRYERRMSGFAAVSFVGVAAVLIAASHDLAILAAHRGPWRATKCIAASLIDSFDSRRDGQDGVILLAVASAMTESFDRHFVDGQCRRPSRWLAV